MIIDYRDDIQNEVENFFKIVLSNRGWGFEPEGRHASLRNIANVYPKEKGGFWLKTDKEKIIGTVAIRLLNDLECIGELKSMYVLPEYQGKGYGKELLKHALLQAKDRDYKFIRLDTTSDSYNAIGLYKKAGFYEIDRYNDNNFAELFMEIEI